MQVNRLESVENL